MGPGSVLLLGLGLGLRHALDPDHLAAVSALVARNPRTRRVVAVGLLWGLGHAATLVLLGGALLWLGLVLPAWAAALGEATVGLVVLAMGVGLLLRLRREQVHLHVHEHGGARHLHLHSHAHGQDHAHPHPGKRALLVGMLHGLAGSGGLALLAAASSGSRMEGLAFLVVFGLGAALAMGLAAGGLALPLRLGARTGARALVGLRAASGLAAVGIGAVLVLASARAAWLAW